MYTLYSVIKLEVKLNVLALLGRIVIENLVFDNLLSQALVLLVTRTRSLLLGSVTQHSLDIFNLRHFNDVLGDQETNESVAIPNYYYGLGVLLIVHGPDRALSHYYTHKR